MKIKKVISLFASLIIMSCTAVNVFADTLTERDGFKYLVSDSGEEKGLYSGWTKRGDDYYYYANGVKKKNCWLTSNGERKYFLQADGSRAVGKVTILGEEFKFDKNGVKLPDEWGITFTVKDVTPTGCTAVFTQSGGTPTGDLETGTFYDLERYENGRWRDVEELPSEYDKIWDDLAYMLPKDESREFEHKWELWYGELPEGKYRIGKNVYDFRRTADYDEKMYWAYFDIKDGEEIADIYDPDRLADVYTDYFVYDNTFYVNVQNEPSWSRYKFEKKDYLGSIAHNSDSRSLSELNDFTSAKLPVGTKLYSCIDNPTIALAEENESLIPYVKLVEG